MRTALRRARDRRTVEGEPKPDAVLQEARIARKAGLDALRELSELGEYDGFRKPKAKRYKQT